MPAHAIIDGGGGTIVLPEGPGHEIASGPSFPRIHLVTPPKKIARLIRLPDSGPSVRDQRSTGEPADLAQWLSVSGEEMVRQLDAWHAPTLTDGVVDALATIFLMRPEHAVIPFFLWLDERLGRWGGEADDDIGDRRQDA